LQQMMAAAFVQLPNADQRAQDLGRGDFALINGFAEVNGCICGTFHRWTQGESQLVVDRVAGLPAWRIVEVRPPEPQTEPGQAAVQRDFLPHTLYFCVYQNHCIVAQTQVLMAGHLGSYLGWLVRQAGAAIAPQGQGVQLYPASAATLRARGVNRAKGVRIQTKLYEAVERQPVPGDRRRGPWREKILNNAKVALLNQILRTLNVEVGQGITAADETKHLELDLYITRPNDRSDAGNATMNAIAGIVAQQESDDYSVILADNSELKGATLKLSKPVEFALPEGATHPPPLLVYNEMTAYVLHLVDRNMV
jgi:hypothetical protein